MSPEEYGSDRTPQQPGSGQPPQGYPPPGAPQGYQPPPGAPQGYPPPEPRRDRRPEKQDEKENEKQQEKGQSLDEKYRRNPLGLLSLAFLIVWLGVMLLLMNTDVIDDEKGWAVFAWGGAVIIFAEAFIRLAVPKWRRSVMGSFIWGAVWAGVGFGLWFDRWEVIGPLVVIAIGLGLILGRLIPRS
jgi:hypothetical protein